VYKGHPWDLKKTTIWQRCLIKLRFRLAVDDSNRPLLTGGRCSQVVVKSGLTAVAETQYDRSLRKSDLNFQTSLTKYCYIMYLLSPVLIVLIKIENKSRKVLSQSGMSVKCLYYFGNYLINRCVAN
jgi:hypothetical protein